MNTQNKILLTAAVLGFIGGVAITNDAVAATTSSVVENMQYMSFNDPNNQSADRTYLERGKIKMISGDFDNQLNGKGMTLVNNETLDSTTYDSTGLNAQVGNTTIKFTTNGISAGNQKINSVAAGTADTDAVNVSQLNSLHKDVEDLAEAQNDINTAVESVLNNHKTAINNATAEAKKHTTVVAGDNVTVTTGTNTNGGTEYTVSVDRSTIDSIAKASNRFAGDDVIKVERFSAPSNVADLTTFTYDGEKAATKTPLTYKANGTTETVMLSDGLNFTNGNNTTASVGSDGVVKYDLNKNITVDSVTADKANISGVTIDNNGIDAGGKTITNVARSTDADSAATVGQINDLVNAMNSGNTDTLNRANSYTDSQVAKVGAQSAALAGLHPLDFNKNDKASYAASFGHYRNANAVAVGAFYRPNERTMISTAVSFGQHPQVNVGVAFKVGKGSEYVNEAKSKDSRIAKLEALVDKLTAEVAELKAAK